MTFKDFHFATNAQRVDNEAVTITRLGRSLVVVAIWCCALLFTGVRPAFANVVDLTKTTSSETVNLFGESTLVVVGNNPLRSIVTVAAPSTTTAAGPTPAFLPSTGNQTPGTGTQQQTAQTRGLTGPALGTECLVTGQITAADSLYNWTTDIVAAQVAVDNLLQTVEVGLPTPVTDSAAITAFKALAGQISGLAQYKQAAACLDNLAKTDLTVAGIDPTVKASITALIAPASTSSAGSPYYFMRSGGTVPANQVYDALPSYTCEHLFAKTSNTTQAITVQPSTFGINGSPPAETISVTQKCLGQVAISAGVSFVGARQQTFSAVSTPNGTTAPTSATVQQATNTSFQTIPTAYVHWSPFSSCQGSDGCFYLTFGAGVTSVGGSTTNNINYLFGVSGSFSRYAYVTFGAATGQITNAAPGYNPGTIVPTGASIPTVTNGVTRIFIGISFGTSP